MRRVRVIPVLTLQNEKLVKTVKFKNANYIGDPINAVKIFNEKEVDEIVILDITATQENRAPNYTRIEEIASEAFMPFAYGGGIQNIDQIKKLFKLGIEKVVLNSCVENNMNLISEASKIYGAQSVVVSIDVKKNLFGKYQIFKNSGGKKVKDDLVSFLNKIEAHGAGEVFLNSIEKDGTYAGYDKELIELVSKNTTIPVVACGGANNVESLTSAVVAGASAVAAGSIFVYTGKTKGILINYPKQEELFSKVYQQV